MLIGFVFDLEWGSCRWRFARSPDAAYSMGLPANAAMLPQAHAMDFGRVLTQKGYQVFLEKGSLYAFKGLAGKLGPIGVHASMLAIMAGVRPLLHPHMCQAKVC